ncbi:MAG TPA: RecX family transcriptional regulator [Thermoleophilaceae bacterium]|nr:RecX family transcriptional regulator [Thermoleophilaceae bacterium]
MGSHPDEQAELERALGFAYRAIGRREHTVAQIRELLGGRGIDKTIIQAAVEELRESGLLDDGRFARRFAGDKRDLEQWGSRRIATELDRRGIGAQEIEAVVGARGRRDELDSALLLLERRLPRGPWDDRERDRAWRLLVRRGYEPELAYEAVREHARGPGEGPSAA